MRSIPFAALALACTLSAQAQVVQVQFSGIVFDVAPGAPAGVSAGDSFEGTIRFDLGASVAAPNPYSGAFASATYYPLQAASAQIRLGTAVLDVWPGPLIAFAWNDEDRGQGPVDGLLFLNQSSYLADQFQLGNIIYPGSTFGDESLPSGDVPGSFAFSFGPAGTSPTVSGSGSTLFISAVPEPGTAAMGLGGLLLLAGLRRGYSTSLA